MALSRLNRTLANHRTIISHFSFDFSFDSTRSHSKTFKKTLIELFPPQSYFRELPEPLFVFAIYDDLVQCAGIANTNDRLTALWKIVNAMPKPHIENLRYLIKFFARLSASSEVNKMTPQNLAIAIAPSLIWQPPAASAEGNSSPSSAASPMTYGLDMCSANQYGIIIETLILYSDWFFPGEIKFDSLKANRKRSSSADQPSTPGRSQQSSPKSMNKSSFSAGVSRTPIPMERNPPQPSITPRMSTRSKKQPAPIPPISKALNQSNGIQTGLDLSNQNLNFNESTSHQQTTSSSSNFVTNSPFLNSPSYSFQSEPKREVAGQSEVPTLKSFERKGSLEHQPFAGHTSKHHHGSNSSSGTGSTSDSQDSVNSFNSNTVIEGGPQKFDPNNRSNDSLLSSSRTEQTSDYQRLEQQFKLSSSSSENLLDDIPANSVSTPRAQTKKAMMASQHQAGSGNNLIGGSLDRRQLSQLRNERSRQINQHKTSSSFMNPNRPRNRPSSIPPEPPTKPAPLGKPRSHDDLLMDGGEPGAVRFSSLKRDEEPETREDKDEEPADKKYNLKLDVQFNVKGADYEGEEEETAAAGAASGDSSCLVSYVKLEGNEVKFGNSAETGDTGKPPEKPPRTSPPLEKPPRPQAPTIFKSSKSLMSSEHTYL